MTIRRREAWRELLLSLAIISRGVLLLVCDGWHGCGLLYLVHFRTCAVDNVNTAFQKMLQECLRESVGVQG